LQQHPGLTPESKTVFFNPRKMNDAIINMEISVQISVYESEAK